MQEQVWKRNRGEAARLEERDREVAQRERRVSEEEAAAARGGHLVIPKLEGDTPATDRERPLPFQKRARGEGDDSGHERGKRRQVEQWGAGGPTGALQPARLGAEPTPTDWVSASPLPRHLARHPARREQGRVQGWRAGGMAELVRYVKWAGRTREGREQRGTHPFRDLVRRAGRPQDSVLGMAEDMLRRMLAEALPGLVMDGPRERGRTPTVQMLRELLQSEG